MDSPTIYRIKNCIKNAIILKKLKSIWLLLILNRLENRLNTTLWSNSGYKNIEPSMASTIDTNLAISVIGLLFMLLVIEK